MTFSFFEMRLGRLRLFFSLCLVFLTLTSCNKKKVTLSGEVFVVTKGAESIPLGLVSVGIIPLEVLGRNLDSALSVFDQEILGFENPIKDYKDKIESEVVLKAILWDDVEREASKKTLASFAEKGRPYAMIDAKPEFNYFKKWMSYSEELRGQVIEERGVDYWAERFKLKTLKDYFNQKQKIDPLLEELEELENSLEEFKKSSRVLEILGENFHVTKTNSQGNFSFELEEGSYLVFANSSRMVGSSTERYIWAVEVSIEGNKNDFFLSNDNLTSIEEIRLLNTHLKIKS